MLSTQFTAALSCARSSIFRLLDRLSADDQHETGVDIVVSGGVHAGCRTHVDAAGFSIGADTSSDIMLLDPEMKGLDIKFRIIRTLFGIAATLLTDRDDVKLNGIGNKYGAPYARLPCTVSIGTINLEIRPTDRDGDAFKSSINAATVFSFGTFGAAALVASFFVPGANSATVTISPPAIEQRQLTPPVTVAGSIQTQIVETQLERYISADSGPDNTVFLSGTVPKNMMPMWRDLRDTIDASPEADRVIAQVKQASALNDVPLITMVRLKPVPSVLLANGTALSIGDILVSDWEIIAVSAAGIEVARAGEKMKIQF